MVAATVEGSPRTRHLLEDGSPRFTNRLADEPSPYLRQHAHNPVDWWPWSDAAFEEAKRLGRPVLLSVGYSTCHWCHVMEEESFEDLEIARFINEHYVAIKVDREQRPDIDAQYMLATQLFTQRGGWPNSVWLTPDGRPWFAGTYFPREDQGGRPGFKTILLSLADTWATKRPDVEKQADAVVDAMQPGEVVLDFNKTYTPPCAFTEYATCPVPLEQNRLPVPVTAGEKTP